MKWEVITSTSSLTSCLQWCVVGHFGSGQWWQRRLVAPSSPPLPASRPKNHWNSQKSFSMANLGLCPTSVAFTRLGSGPHPPAGPQPGLGLALSPGRHLMLRAAPASPQPAQLLAGVVREALAARTWPDRPLGSPWKPSASAAPQHCLAVAV